MSASSLGCSAVEEPTRTSLRQHRHLGVYGVCLHRNMVLLVRKARGPYVGLLDLPGGGIEFGEEPEAALRREFLEETGITVANVSLRSVESTRMRYVAADGVDEELHHVGLIYDVSVAAAEARGVETLPTLKTAPDGEDSDGASWATLSSIDKQELTPFARIALFGVEAGEVHAVTGGADSDALADNIPTFGRREPDVDYKPRDAAYAVILRSGTVATVRSKVNGRYFLVGGGAWTGKSPEVTILREIVEETGCQGALIGRIGEAIQLFYAKSDDQHYRMRAVFFTAELAENGTNHEDEAEFASQEEQAEIHGEEALCWLPVEAARHCLFHACHAWAVEAAAFGVDGANRVSKARA